MITRNERQIASRDGESGRAGLGASPCHRDVAPGPSLKPRPSPDWMLCQATGSLAY